MKIDFMMTITALSFFVVLSILYVDYYVKHEAVKQGLQQCITSIDGRNQVIWTKQCQS